MKLYSEYTLEELLGFVRAGEGCEGLYDAIAEKVASLRSQHSRDEAVVEAATELLNVLPFDSRFHRDTHGEYSAYYDAQDVLRTALAAREEAGQ